MVLDEHTAPMEAAPRGDKGRSQGRALVALDLAARAYAILALVGLDAPPYVAFGAVALLRNCLAPRPLGTVGGADGPRAECIGAALVRRGDRFWTGGGAASVGGLVAAAAGVWLDARRRGEPGWAVFVRLLLVLIALLIVGFLG